MESLEKLKTFDAYAKTHDEFKIKTKSGALISLGAVLVSLLLIVYEYWDYRSVSFRPELVVDNSQAERMPITINITFPKLPCNLLSFDVMDVSGEQQNNIDHDIFKTRLDEFGNAVYSLKEVRPAKEKELMDPNYCGDCYGAPVTPTGGCCNTCQDIINSYSASGWSTRNLADFAPCVREGKAEKLDFSVKEGCTIHGRFMVNKVAGNFHIAPGHSFQHSSMHVHDIQGFVEHMGDLNYEHIIHTIKFGDSFDGQINPLDGISKVNVGDAVFFQYYIKVVPTQVNYLNSSILLTNQYSVTQHERMRNSQVVPGIFFNYDISPMKVIYTQYQKPFSSFLANVCAILGGVFTVAGFIDSVTYKAERVLKEKKNLGKYN